MLGSGLGFEIRSDLLSQITFLFYNWKLGCSCWFWSFDLVELII